MTSLRLAILEYGDFVATKKITITIPEDAVARLKEFAEETGVPLSTYIAQLVEHEIRIRDGLAALREWEAEDGPLTEEELAAARAELEKAAAHARARAPKRAGAVA
jgi:predicted transcriptional regulator